MSDRESIAAHEAGHACACVLLNVGVKLIDIAGDATALGRVRHEGEDNIRTREDARKRMLIILCGPFESDDWEAIPKWPLHPGRSTDEYNLKALADALGLDERGYNDVLFEAIDLTLTPEYRMLHTAITGMLDYVPRIGPELLEQLHDIARRNTP